MIARTAAAATSRASTIWLLAVAASPATSMHDALGKAQYATTPATDTRPATHPGRPPLARRASLSAVAAGRSSQTGRPWTCSPGSWPPLRDLGQDDLLTLADAYAGPAEQIAAADLAVVHRRQGLDSRLEGVIIGTVLGDTLLAVLRRLAEEDASARHPGSAPSGTTDISRPAGSR